MSDKVTDKIKDLGSEWRKILWENLPKLQNDEYAKNLLNQVDKS